MTIDSELNGSRHSLNLIATNLFVNVIFDFDVIRNYLTTATFMKDLLPSYL
jgi:hypothetical protein